MDDPDFRESLIADPRTTITDATGTEFPEDVEIVVVEDKPHQIHVVLPSTDIDLNQIEASGGMTCSALCGPLSPGMCICG